MGTKGRPKVRYAVVGAGNIAQVAVLPAFEHAKENSELVAIVSGDEKKRAELCKKYELEVDGDYADFEDVLRRGRIGAVYIATPNASHKEFTLRAAAAGVHVLCEKPLATSVADAEEMAQACQQAGVKLMVAYRLHFEEATLKALELVSQGRLGEVKLFESAFSHVVRPGDIRTQPEEGGGAILDLGVYCINAARHVFQAEPHSAFAVTVKKNGIDDSSSVILRFSNDRVAQFSVSNSLASVSSYRIVGTEGDLRVEPAYDYVEGLEHYLTIDEKTEHESFRKRDQFAPELVHFSECILEGRAPVTAAEEGICDLRVIEAILESGASGRVVELEPRRHAHHPTPDQEMYKPPVSKQKTVNADSPSLK
jgi:predicted dehydrogenase